MNRSFNKIPEHFRIKIEYKLYGVNVWAATDKVELIVDTKILHTTMHADNIEKYGAELCGGVGMDFIEPVEIII